MNRDTGIRSIIPGVKFDSEIKEDLRSQIAMRKRLEGTITPKPVQSPDIRFAPAIDLKPTEIVHKEGEYGHPGYWKSEKELENYMANDAIKMEKTRKFRQDPEWVASHNRRFPKSKTTQLPNKERQQPQYGVNPINGHDESTYAYNQKEALATADAMDNAVANTKTRINQIHKNPASKIIEKQQSIKDLQRVTDIAYKYSNDQWAHKPEWKLDRKTGSPIDVADPKTQNDRTVKQLQNLKNFSQGSKVNAPHVKLQAANKADPAAGAKYIDWWDRIETKNRT